MLNKRLNLILSNGLCVLNAKLRKDGGVATLFITDFSTNTRVLFDIEGKRILANRDDIEFTPKDVENLIAALAK